MDEAFIKMGKLKAAALPRGEEMREGREVLLPSEAADLLARRYPKDYLKRIGILKGFLRKASYSSLKEDSLYLLSVEPAKGKGLRFIGARLAYGEKIVLLSYGPLGEGLLGSLCWRKI